MRVLDGAKTAEALYLFGLTMIAMPASAMANSSNAASVATQETVVLVSSSLAEAQVSVDEELTLIQTRATSPSPIPPSLEEDETFTTTNDPTSRGYRSADKSTERHRFMAGMEGRRASWWDDVSDFDAAETTFQALNAIDAVQTITFLKRGAASEKNFILGRNPSAAAVIGYKAAMGIGHLLVARHLKTRNPRAAKAWQYGFIIGTGAVVALNMRYVM